MAAKLKSEIQFLTGVLDLKKAYARVARKILIRKIEKLYILEEIINQVIVFLLPLLVTTAGDVTGLVVDLRQA